MREYFLSLASENQGRKAFAAMRRHEDQIACLIVSDIDNRFPHACIKLGQSFTAHL
jgi:hypothetical protein